MIYMWFTGINYSKLAVEKDRDSIFTTITTIWKPGIQGASKKVRPFRNSPYIVTIWMPESYTEPADA